MCMYSDLLITVVPGSGCSRPEILYSSISLDPEDSTFQIFTVSCNDGYHFSTSSVEIAYRVLCKEGGWWLLSTCTGI